VPRVEWMVGQRRPVALGPSERRANDGGAPGPARWRGEGRSGGGGVWKILKEENGREMKKKIAQFQFHINLSVATSPRNLRELCHISLGRVGSSGSSRHR
jgi:hypothetical protein